MTKIKYTRAVKLYLDKQTKGLKDSEIYEIIVEKYGNSLANRIFATSKKILEEHATLDPKRNRRKPLFINREEHRYRIEDDGRYHVAIGNSNRFSLSFSSFQEMRDALTGMLRQVKYRKKNPRSGFRKFFEIKDRSGTVYSTVGGMKLAKSHAQRFANMYDKQMIIHPVKLLR